MKTLTLLGGLTAERFMQEYWHKKPLLIRQAIPGMQAVLERDALFALAQQDDVESRLVTHFNQAWKMQSGPLDALPALTKKAWTLLVQGVNLHDDNADALLRQFRFLPDARLDDLMISYASDGGGVGPHVDSYDVFLLQAHGQRRWSIGPVRDATLVDNVPLKILRHFDAEESFVLEPGDMLYLPPHYAHDGVAIGECMTCSIGFRAPEFQELGNAFLQFMADSIDLPGRYADADAGAVSSPAEIPQAMLAQVASELDKMRFTPDDIAIFLGQYLSEPKASVVFEPPARRMALAAFARSAAKQGVKLVRKSQMLYRGEHVFINGESFAVSSIDLVPLAQLADQRELDGPTVAGVSGDVLEALHMWHQDGWLALAGKQLEALRCERSSSCGALQT
ncbi:MAG: JmjC domain-containing protein [Janthinobacterium lividum]